MIFRRGRAGALHSEFERALRRSLRAAVEGDGERAQSWLERAVELDSGDFDAYQALARLYRDRGEVGRALRMHQNLLLRSDLDRDQQADAKLELARDYEAGGYRERATAIFDELLTERRRDPDVLEAACLASLDAGDPERARSLHARLHHHDPQRARALESRLAEAGAIERPARPTGSGIVSRFVAGFGARRREAAALRTLGERLDRDDADHGARIALARIEVSRGQPERARELLARGLERHGDALLLHVELGRLWLASGQEGEALKAYARLIDAIAGAVGPASDEEHAS